VELMKSGSTFVTIFWDAATGGWTLGQPVCMSCLDGVEFLKVKNDMTLSDDLGNVPEF
jgi:hypothetical protein